MSSITIMGVLVGLLLNVVESEHISVPRNFALTSSPSYQSPEVPAQQKVRSRNLRIRSFMEATSSTTSSVLGDNDIDDDPIPSKVWIPSGLDFSCRGRAPGYYTDPSPLSKCQVYHMCMPDGRKYSMLCGIGTVFNQITFVCDHWYNYHCSDAVSDYQRNDQLWDQFLSPIKEAEQEYEYDDFQTTPAP